MRLGPSLSGAVLCALVLAGCGDTPVARSSAPSLPVTGASGTPAPVPTANPHPTVVTFVTAPAHAGRSAALRADTAPGAACRATLTVAGRAVRASGLVAKDASAAGKVSWSFTVPSRTARGEWPLVVACSPGGEAATLLLVQ
jgi:hypothetical protein